jgi:hypothetical protein
VAKCCSVPYLRLTLYSTIDTTLELLREEASKTADGEHHANAITYLQQAMESYCTGGIMSGIMTWPVTLSDDYVSRIEVRDPMALVILAHYGVIVHLLRDRWWAADYGKRLVHAILPILLEFKEEWAELVQRSWTAVASDQSSHNTPLPGH